VGKKPKPAQVTVIGAGLAGSEATFQLVRRGIPVKLIEMRGKVSTGAHRTGCFAELVCSNSLGSNLPDRASGLLKEEMRAMGSYILDSAYKYRVPAGQALAVDRDAFAREITRYLKGHSLVEFVEEECTSIPTNGIVIIATGPLTSPAMAKQLEELVGKPNLFFFDAIAPLVTAESIDKDLTFRADRYGEGKGDYLNCPMNKDEYELFVSALVQAEKIPLAPHEKISRKTLFMACQPIEEIAASGVDSLRFGPLKPVGLIDPSTKRRPYAVLQLRQDNLLANLYNLVGCQTNLRHSEQERVFRLVPALRKAQFVRLGQMHRNTYINSPHILTKTLQTRKDPSIFIAGQITGVEGYTESVAMGLIAGFNAARISLGKQPVTPPPETITGALIHYITFEQHKNFTPMNANFGLFKEEKEGDDDIQKRNLLILRARKAFRQFMESL